MLLSELFNTNKRGNSKITTNKRYQLKKLAPAKFYQFDFTINKSSLSKMDAGEITVSSVGNLSP